VSPSQSPSPSPVSLSLPAPPLPADHTAHTQHKLIPITSQNSDVYLGWTGWAAGGFYPGSYALDEVPVESSSGVWTDTPLVVDCIAGEFLN
jgi:hypothetical protein